MVSDVEKQINGKVKFWNAQKGFGFIVGEDGKEYFVHHSAVIGDDLASDELVCFTASSNERGPLALGVVQLEEGNQ